MGPAPSAGAPSPPPPAGTAASPGGGAVVDVVVVGAPGPGNRPGVVVEVVVVVEVAVVVDVVVVELDVVLDGPGCAVVVELTGGSCWSLICADAPSDPAITSTEAARTAAATRRRDPWKCMMRDRFAASDGPSCPSVDYRAHSRARNRATRSSVGGWLRNRLANWTRRPVNGLTMNACA